MINGKYNVVCRYWKQGTCKNGKQCKFYHSELPSSVKKNVRYPNFTKGSGYISPNRSSSPSREPVNAPNLLNSSSSSVDDNEEMCTTPYSERDGRRPFLQIVVLYANDSKVFHYSKEVQSQFLENGIDVYLQIGIENVSNKDLKHTDFLEKDTEIKTDNLAEIITTSIADFLIVIGDRNMKNKSCQAKKQGRLVEMDVEDMINAIWNEWAPYQTIIDEEEANNMPIEKIQSILEDNYGLRGLNDKLKKLNEMLNELKAMKVDPNKLHERGINPHEDSKFAGIMTNIQKYCIRFHQSLKAVLSKLLEMRNSETIIVDQSQYGSKIGPDYNPQNSNRSFCPPLRERLIRYLEEFIHHIEDSAKILLDYGAPLWISHLSQYMDNETFNKNNFAEYNYTKNQPNVNESLERNNFSNDPHTTNDWEQVKSLSKKLRKINLESNNVNPQLNDKNYINRKDLNYNNSEYNKESQPSTVPQNYNSWQNPPNNVLYYDRHNFNENAHQYQHDQSKYIYSLINSLWKSSGYEVQNYNDEPPNTFEGWVKAFHNVTEYELHSTNLFKTNHYFYDHLYRAYNPDISNYNEDNNEYKLKEEEPINIAEVSNAKRPCLYCGKESRLECYICSKNGEEAYFCSEEHQRLIWKVHVSNDHRFKSNVTFSPLKNGKTKFSENNEYFYVNNLNKTM